MCIKLQTKTMCMALVPRAKIDGGECMVRTGFVQHGRQSVTMNGNLWLSEGLLYLFCWWSSLYLIWCGLIDYELCWLLCVWITCVGCIYWFYIYWCVISYQESRLAQLVERETVNLEVSGSIPLVRVILHHHHVWQLPPDWSIQQKQQGHDCGECFCSTICCMERTFSNLLTATMCTSNEK